MKFSQKENFEILSNAPLKLCITSDFEVFALDAKPLIFEFLFSIKYY